MDAPAATELQLDLSPEEQGLALRRASRRLLRSARQAASPAGAFGAWFLAGLMAMLVYRLAGNPGEFGLYGVPLLVLGACIWAFRTLLLRRRLARAVGASLAGASILKLDEGGITLANGRGEFCYFWSALAAIETDPAGIALHFTGFQALWLPDRCFPDQAARQAFVARIEAASGLAATPVPAEILQLPDEGRFWPDFAANLRAGMLFLFCQPAAVDRLRPATGQFLALVGAPLALSLALDLFTVGKAGEINWSALPALLFGIPWLLLAPWAASLGDRSRCLLAGGVALAALWLPIDFVGVAWLTAVSQPGAPVWLQPEGPIYLVWLAIFLWGLVASIVALVRVLGLPAEERMAAVLAVFCLILPPNLVPRGELHLWVPQDIPDSQVQEEAEEESQAPVPEEVLYAQPQLLHQALAGIRPGRPGVPELFLLAVGGNGNQDVFRREVESVQQMFDRRFGTAGHSLALLNNPATALDHPIASVTALRQALTIMGKKMNRDEDVLLLFMTSHGSPDHHFDLTLWPYRFAELTPDVLRDLLDEAGIRYRVVVVSACYSGGFVPPLADPDTLVISASRADRNSHGCSHEAEWTFFGKAFFDEALRQTVSFETAFTTASRQVAAREKAEALTPSEPQMAMGPGIRQALGRLEKRWPAQP